MKIMCLFVVVSCFCLIWIGLVLGSLVANCDWWKGCECLWMIRVKICKLMHMHSQAYGADEANDCLASSLVEMVSSLWQPHHTPLTLCWYLPAPIANTIDIFKQFFVHQPIIRINPTPPPSHTPHHTNIVSKEKILIDLSTDRKIEYQLHFFNFLWTGQYSFYTILVFNTKYTLYYIYYFSKTFKILWISNYYYNNQNNNILYCYSYCKTSYRCNMVNLISNVCFLKIFIVIY